MQRIHLEAAVILGILISHISSLSNVSPPSDCVAAVDTCMSDLCKRSEEAFVSQGVCEGCQIKGLAVCNMTIQTALDQFPSLHRCVCAWEEERCDSIQSLATQCHQKPAAKQRRSSVMDWQSSDLLGYVYDHSASCLDQIGVCVSDAVCNRYLADVLQACMAQCDRDRCQQATQQFFGNMPHNVAEMLVMCECDTSDHSCLKMTTTLHSGTCGGHTRICQDTVNQCVEDSNCRDLLKTFRAKCWSPEEAHCSDSDLQHDECITRMDPAFIRGEESECKIAFLATLGTALHYPCACKRMRNDDLLSCNMIHDVLHNRSHFMTPWKSSSGPTEPPKHDESEQGPTWSHDYLMYAFVSMLLVGVVVLIPLAVASKIWMLRRKDKIKFHHPQKSNCVVIL
ncbi:GDNF family receptor alpha-like isoform X2 [Pseudoliparis swirei]|uniref:GDNF family receptor alpha-like isoform X2 n=1 Tax=Pseudoliparis swirei TaxID=2059687 RepID=UPI0024BDFE10|nr:GDNF family receptor alpha-like isoform X2 [Pseudoliparis swirei]